MITDSRNNGHIPDMESIASAESVGRDQQPSEAKVVPLRCVNPSVPKFGDVYEQYFEFIWRSARRLGVPVDNLDDAVQDVFLTVHRRLNEFRGESSVRTWLFGILLHTVRGYRRTARRKPTCALQTESVVDSKHPGPLETAANGEAVELVYQFLDSLDDDKRQVFVLAEIEQMTAQEIAESMGTNANTVYSRLRSARQSFEEAVVRYQARDGWRYK
jgi:RNA polymerase sigma-70 factor, ECF subfamily